MSRSRLFTALLAPVLLMLTACGINSIPRAEEAAKAKWADVQAEFQRRANLIGNIVETVRAQAGSEQQILVGVTQARADATRITVSGDQLNDEAAMARLAEAQSRLNSTLVLQRLQEAYPNIESQKAFRDLRVSLEGSENRVQLAIHDYNEAVQEYNSTIRTFPSVIGAKVIYGSQPLVPYQAATPGAETAPTINLGQPAAPTKQ